MSITEHNDSDKSEVDILEFYLKYGPINFTY